MPKPLTTLEEFSRVVCGWASQQPVVNRVWIFGSYAKGTQKPSSDLDVAVELHAPTLAYVRADTWWYRHSSALGESLKVLIPVPLDMQLYHRRYDPRIYGFVRELTLGPVYRRPQSKGRPGILLVGASPPKA